jgi:hypothetical protein
LWPTDALIATKMNWASSHTLDPGVKQRFISYPIRYLEQEVRNQLIGKTTGLLRPQKRRLGAAHISDPDDIGFGFGVGTYRKAVLR